jgi:hypothetical protein
VPVLLNDVRRVLLSLQVVPDALPTHKNCDMLLQPQQAASAVALLQELSGAVSRDNLGCALAQLQLLPVDATDDDSTSELENEAAAALLQAWQQLCAAVGNAWLG